jgi:hypothetical protein
MAKINKFALWQAVLSDIRGIVHESLRSELSELGQIDRIAPDRITIAVLSQAVVEQCEGVYQEDFENVLSELFERKVAVTFIYDKKRLWQNILDDLCDDLDTGLYFSLQEKAYIERIDPDKVVIGVFSQAIKTQCEKQYRFKIGKACSAALERKVEVLFAEAAPRLYVDLPFEEKPREVREAILHGDHGDIMTIVDNDPLFKKVALPLEEGGWGMNPKKLTNDCKDYGVVAVQDGLARVARKEFVKKPAIYFEKALKRGDFGGKLPRGADILGLRSC